MIFLDANIILRLLTPPATPEDDSRKIIVRRLFERVANGEVEVTTSELVLHEVAYVLCSSKQYRYPVAEVAPVLRDMIQWTGFSIPAGDLRIFLLALELWERHPRLEFSDAVIASRCDWAGHELATFDSHFDAIPFLTLWQPEPDEPVPEASESSP